MPAPYGTCLAPGIFDPDFCPVLTKQRLIKKLTEKKKQDKNQQMPYHKFKVTKVSKASKSSSTRLKQGKKNAQDLQLTLVAAEPEVSTLPLVETEVLQVLNPIEGATMKDVTIGMPWRIS